ncbi:Uma2 family endonuclease [Nonomuraea purpurea]|uniref:Uma2 family endonuclease n=1 Tax=Nonomuraea purpurea TaxID=1849276 RepID=A0ABV8GA56_9ACTN
MTAEAVIPEMTSSSLPDWVFPPPGGFAAEALDHIPDLPAHTELIDGSLVFVRPRASFHTLLVDLLTVALRQAAPARMRVRREMSLILAKAQRPEPDLMVIKTEAVRGNDDTYYKAGDVVLIVEVVSPESKVRDHRRKPQLYAEAGISHFWLIEKNSGGPTAYVYELDPVTRSYVITGIHRDRLKLTVPFDLDIDLTEIDDL